ncbi:biotin transport system substrate-specific component [Virgibacillus natechei]|uniref:Biotin transporter n=1 Tax=Virgibacillus natechei TaxID=1216297 RepID=A0ABS4ILD8_9BACI|nr:biotin transporter BioY [Virgibacillus natechei]MBP1971106.1 biotin transport system substrate-specific component [Virgibacillus natechei]UZD12207.1 biotin transporter BioY [Virgibacillus natechei]
MSESSYKLRMMIITALFAAIIGILAQVTIPLPLVPITGQTLALGLAATILGSKYGTISVILYVIIGAIGVPVFSHMQAGLGVVFGPTGGFIIGFAPAAFVIGYYLEKTNFTILNAVIANVIGMLIALLFGTVWLKFIASLTWPAAFASGFAPFIIVGLLKAFLAAWIGIVVRNRLASADLLYTRA